MPTWLTWPGSIRTTWNAFSWAGGSPVAAGKVTYNYGTALPGREPTFLTLKVTPMSPSATSTRKSANSNDV